MRNLIIAAVCAACGLAAASTLTASATEPVTLPDLPGLGYSLSMQANAQTGCNNYVVVGGNGVDREILIGDLPPVCSTAQQEQDRIDALLAAFPPPGAAPVTTTAYGTTTETVTLPAVTEPAVTVTLPAVTLPAETVEHTTTVHDVQTVTVTTPAPTNDTAVPRDPPWLLALAARSQAMNDAHGLT